MSPLRATFLAIFLSSVAALAAEDAAAPRSTSLAQEKGYLLSDSGQWRTRNRDFEPGTEQPKEFGLNYRWGPHRKHIVGELIGIGESGGTAVYATVYFTFNPVSQQVHADLVSWDGTLGPAIDRRIDANHRVIEGVFYKPDGTVTSNRHTFELIDSHSYISRSYDLNDEGAWELKREETWRQLRKEESN